MTYRSLLVVSLTCLLVPVAALAGDWAQFRGPGRDGTVEASGLMSSWPAGGPREVWRRAVGAGYSGVSVAGDRLFTMASSDDGSEELVLCLDAASGETLWQRAVGASKTSDLGDTGPRTTPLIEGDLVYVASSAGTIFALEREGGTVVWQRPFEGAAPRFGYSVSPLIDGDLLIVESGGSEEQPGVLALDRRSGELRWSALAGPSGYSSPIVAEIGGVRQYIFFRRVGNEVVSLSVEGDVLWRHATAALAVITTPIFYPPDRVFVASADDAFGGSMLRVSNRNGAFEVEELWNAPRMRNHFSTSVLVDGHLYGFDNGTFRCLDAGTGAQRWAKRGFGKGSLIAAGHLLFVLGDGGTLALVQATPEAYRELGRVQAMQGRAWTAPTLASGRIYVRDFDEMVSYEVARDAALEEILAAYEAARGGAQSWREVSSIRMSGTYAAFSDYEPFSLVRGSGDRYRLDFSILGGPAVRARDEQGVWWRHPLLQPEAGRLEEGPYQRMLQRESLFAPPLMDAAVRGIAVELVGDSEIDGTPAVELGVTLPDGSQERWFLDPASSLEIAVESEVHDFTQSQEPMRQRVFYDDFREIEGLVVPHRLDAEFGHRLESMTVDRVDVNVELPESAFEPPAADPASESPEG